jgi:(p)ppGpp synthase/HD superfamily hydrolase
MARLTGMCYPPITMNLIQLAEDIATKAHDGQFRRDGVTPYMTHPVAVATRLKGESETVIAVALLHDILEDTDTRVIHLFNAGLPRDVIDTVVMLTKAEDCSYGDYIAAINRHPIARKVKIADIMDNISDTPTERQILKYARALVVLLG